jgi:hypothetical protein
VNNSRQNKDCLLFAEIFFSPNSQNPLITPKA